MARQLVHVGFGWTTVDQTLLWAATGDVQHGVFRQPHFYGQTYGTTFEVIPAALLGRLGVEPWTAVPLATAALVLLPWLLFAAAARRENRYLFSALAVSAPVLLTSNYLLLITAPRGVAAGIALSGIGAAVLVRRPETTGSAVVFVVCSSLALAFDAGSALLVVPVAIYAVCKQHSTVDRRRLVLLLASLAPALGWLLLCTIFYGRHPEYNDYGDVPFAPQLRILGSTLPRFGQFFAYHTPALAPTPLFAPAAVLVLASVGIVRRRWDLALPSAALLVMLLAVLASPKALDSQGGPYLPPSRLTLSLPYALWFLAFVAWQHHRTSTSAGTAARTRQVRVSALASATLVLLLGCTILQRTHDEDARLAHVLRQDKLSNYLVGLSRVPQVRQSCTEAKRLADANGGARILFSDAVSAYACAAPPYELDTLASPSDRRAWQKSSLGRPGFAVLLLGRAADGCRDITRPALTCRVASGSAGGGEGALYLSSSSLPLADLLHDLGQDPKPLRDAPRPPSCVVSERC